MNFLIDLSYLFFLFALAYGQTKVSTYNCPTGQYNSYLTTAYTGIKSPVLTLANVTYASNGFYTVTSAYGADQCCYNCATQTNGKCTTWTYDGCGKCYLSSATGVGLVYSTSISYTSCGKPACNPPVSGFMSGVIPSPTSPSNGLTTSGSGITTSAGSGITTSAGSGITTSAGSGITTSAGSGITTSAGSGITTSSGATNTVSQAYFCPMKSDVNAPTPPSAATQDIVLTATSSQDCCNKCGQRTGCVGFAFLSGTCWLKSYSPFGTSTPAPTYSLPGIVIGAVQGIVG